MAERFRDYTTTLSALAQEIWVQYPQCQRAAGSHCLNQNLTWRLTCFWSLD